MALAERGRLAENGLMAAADVERFRVVFDVGDAEVRESLS
jgi:hypothetical protein